MTRRVLGMGPTAGDPGGEPTGARLLPVERLVGQQGPREAAEREQPPQGSVHQSGRRRLGPGSTGPAQP
ncbi:hypothetical protein RKD49_007854 [Streptomyces glaucescens]